MNTMTKKTKAALAVATAGMLSVGGAAAFAYWTTAGGGTGTASAASGSAPIVLHASFSQSLTPGETADVSYTADNPNDSNTVVNALTVTSITTSTPQCAASWFDATAVPNSSSVVVGAHALGTPVGTGVLTFHDSTSVNQDACKGATITVNVTSN